MRLCLLAALCLLEAGCAFTAMQLTLPTKTAGIPRDAGEGRQVVVMPFADDRAIGDRCGMKKNGYNMDTADAVCDLEPAMWITDLVGRGLGEAGFDAKDPSHDPAPDTLVVDGSLRRLFVEPVIGAWTGSLEADIHVDLIVSNGRGLKARRTFYSKGVRGGQLIATASPFQIALQRAADDIVANMVEAIAELAREFPSLASAESAGQALAIRGWSLE